MNIMKHNAMCGGSCNGADEMTWNKMNTSVSAQGFDDVKEPLFNS